MVLHSPIIMARIPKTKIHQATCSFVKNMFKILRLSTWPPTDDTIETFGRTASAVQCIEWHLHLALIVCTCVISVLQVCNWNSSQAHESSFNADNFYFESFSGCPALLTYRLFWAASTPFICCMYIFI